MCEIYNKTEQKEVTGYKVLAYIDGELYSTFTGQKIEVGKVPQSPINAKPLSKHWANTLLRFPMNELDLYEPQFAGKTGVFKYIKDANELYFNLNHSDRISDNIPNDSKHMVFVICKVTLGGRIYSGGYGSSDIYASEYIKSIKIVCYDR